MQKFSQVLNLQCGGTCFSLRRVHDEEKLHIGWAIAKEEIGQYINFFQYDVGSCNMFLFMRACDTYEMF